MRTYINKINLNCTTQTRQITIAVLMAVACSATLTHAQTSDVTLGITTYDSWPALIIKTSKTSGEFSQDGKPTVLPAYMAIMCKSPGVVPKVVLFGDTTAGRKQAILPFAIQTASAIDMRFNDESWTKIVLLEKYSNASLPESNFHTRSDNGMKLPGGLVLVDRLAKANSISFKWKVDDSVNFVGEFRTQFETRANADYVDFLKKKCGVLGLK